jgi:hypothetical protein
VLLVEITERLAALATTPRLLAAAVLLLVATFCWCWRQRCLRKSVKEIERQRHVDRMELLHEYGKLLSQARLVADDLPLITRLERIKPPNELEPPTAGSR